MMRPYRLINTTELEHLKQHISTLVQLWSEEYTLNPVHSDLLRPSEPFLFRGQPIVQEQQVVALVESHNRTFFNTLLLNVDEPCFNSLSEYLFLELLHKILHTQGLSLHNTIEEAPDWFYKGSTCLLLRLTSGQDSLTILLNPQQVYSFLTLNNSDSLMEPLDKALEKQRVELDLELTPIHLPINELLNLQAGDLIACDHPLTMPLRLMHNKQVLAHAELGASADHKTLILKRSV